MSGTINKFRLNNVIRMRATRHHEMSLRSTCSCARQNALILDNTFNPEQVYGLKRQTQCSSPC